MRKTQRQDKMDQMTNISIKAQSCKKTKTLRRSENVTLRSSRFKRESIKPEIRRHQSTRRDRDQLQAKDHFKPRFRWMKDSHQKKTRKDKGKKQIRIVKATGQKEAM